MLLLYVSRRARSIPFHMRISHVTKKRQPQADFDPEVDDQQRPTRLRARTTEQFEDIMRRGKAGEFHITALADGRGHGLWIFEVRYPAVADLHTRVQRLDGTEQVFGPDAIVLQRLALLPNLDDPIDRLNAQRLLLRYAVLEGQRE
jgi:hypothetical protein